MANEILLNASDYFTNTQGVITATIRDIGYFEGLYFAFLVWVAAVVTHELGHWIALLSHNPRAKMIVLSKGLGIQLQTGEQADYDLLAKHDKINIYLAGILGGFFPIILAGMIHPLYYLVIPAYVVGMTKDFKLIWRLSVSEKQK
jgi:hypothetical protein